ncbi:hypothetical protein Hokovirus_3_30 [Hokovirus HKV1]|uniref:RING-type domain-containing protein n=1 Tax=Hokovirus HKV1 TaxID=1977638 RepID=A0A1V0SGB4_9VIRU|nr:hypothetical protein Hokovirus_3_30 [Hokovirus HKV1]
MTDIYILQALIRKNETQAIKEFVKNVNSCDIYFLSTLMDYLAKNKLYDDINDIFENMFKNNNIYANKLLMDYYNYYNYYNNMKKISKNILQYIDIYSFLVNSVILPDVYYYDLFEWLLFSDNFFNSNKKTRYNIIKEMVKIKNETIQHVIFTNIDNKKISVDNRSQLFNIIRSLDKKTINKLNNYNYKELNSYKLLNAIINHVDVELLNKIDINVFKNYNDNNDLLIKCIRSVLLPPRSNKPFDEIFNFVVKLYESNIVCINKKSDNFDGSVLDIIKCNYREYLFSMNCLDNYIKNLIGFLIKQGEKFTKFTVINNADVYVLYLCIINNYDFDMHLEVFKNNFHHVIMNYLGNINSNYEHYYVILKYLYDNFNFTANILNTLDLDMINFNVSVFDIFTLRLRIKEYYENHQDNKYLNNIIKLLVDKKEVITLKIFFNNLYQYEFIKLLSKNGYDFNIHNTDGKTIIDMYCDTLKNKEFTNKKYNTVIDICELLYSNGIKCKEENYKFCNLDEYLKCKKVNEECDICLSEDMVYVCQFKHNLCKNCIRKLNYECCFCFQKL